MLKKIGIAVAVLVVALLIAIATRPDSFTVSRSTTVNAPPDVVFGLVNDFHQWNQWSPWAKLDPNQKATHSGAPAGVGAVYEWEGEKTGSGRMEITEVRPAEYVKIKLDFLKPMKANNTAEFTLKPAAGGTTVTWGMLGQHNFVGKAFSLALDMDKMVGPDFEKGLADIKSLSEAEAKRRDEEAKKAAEAAPPTAPAAADAVR